MAKRDIDKAFEKAFDKLKHIYVRVPIKPNEYDVNRASLEKIRNRYGIPNLSSEKFPSKPYGRFMIPLICQRVGKYESNGIIVNTGSPFTYLSAKSIDAILGPNADCGLGFRLSIQKPNSAVDCYVSPATNHFAEVNLLGTNAIDILKITIEKTNSETRTFFLADQSRLECG